MAETIRVLIVDDHALFRRGLALCLAQGGDFEVVGEAEDGQRALDLWRQLRPDLVLMDIQMPGMDGLEATRRIKAKDPAAKIVILTVSGDDRYVFEAITRGAEGYLIKDVKPAALRQLLRGIQAGEAAIEPATATRILEALARRLQGGTSDGPGAALTPREREVLEQVAAGRANREIAAALGVTGHTVKKHLRNILDKLHLQSRMEAATYALQQGMVARPPLPRQE